MQLTITTRVKGHYKDIFTKFDRELFEALKPIGVGLDLLRFDGSKKGDFVMLRITPPFFSKGITWLSEITDNHNGSDYQYFTDEGRTLPWPLVSWRHRHIVKKIDEEHSWIIDDISYKTPNVWLDYMVYPALYFTFYQRVFVYRKFFAKPT
jgi:ligand-binding SRPBCC domain-containing protein